MTVTFIGHSDAPQEIKEELKSKIEHLIKKENADMFYIGTHGNFDNFAKTSLEELQKNHPHIKYFSVLAYLPYKKDNYTDYSKTIFPDEIAKTPKKFAIIKRNQWMIENADIVIFYVKNHFSNAYQFLEYAQKTKKIIIKL